MIAAASSPLQQVSTVQSERRGLEVDGFHPRIRPQHLRHGDDAAIDVRAMREQLLDHIA